MAKQATKRKANENNLSDNLSLRLREAFFIASIAIAAFLLLSFLTFNKADPGWSHTALAVQISNAGGTAGAWVADILLFLFGYLAYLLPIATLFVGWICFKHRRDEQAFDAHLLTIRTVGFLLILITGTGLLNLEINGHERFLPFTSGGVLGNFVGPGFTNHFNFVGAHLLLFSLFLSGVTLFTGLSWIRFLQGIGHIVLTAYEWMKDGMASWQLKRAEKKNIKKQEATAKALKLATSLKPKKTKPFESFQPIQPSAPKIKVKKKIVVPDKQLPLFKGTAIGPLPSISLLDPAEASSGKGYSTEELENMSKTVELKLQDFGVEVQVVAVHPGPVITRFELQLAPGVKVSKLTGLQKDLARSLSVVSVRVVDVIAGKSVVGLELPNHDREIVRLSEVLSTKQYEQARSQLSLALGKDIAGHPVIVDLAKMPHLLVAGTTGSGKSVGVNAMLLSLLYKSIPEDVKMILIDPKMLELSVYDGIPHLLTPVVTDMSEAANALRWCVAEMERRYQLMAALGVRNLAGFNTKVKEGKKLEKPIMDPLWREESLAEQSELEPLPFIVVVIDEYADMMMVVGKKVEALITRIAQKARAAGIHLVLATQRPSVDVVTGLIKANVPSRIAFQVSSKIDSRTVLDQAGAEQLLGHGDMLYLAPGGGVPVRVHGAFVSDQEVHNVVDDWKQRGTPQYREEILRGGGDIPGLPNDGEGASELDALYDEAVAFVTKARKVSISSVQRKLKIGYNRAARIVEDMEAQNVISEMGQNGTREVLAPPPV